MLQDLGRVVDHIIDNLLSREDLVYLSSNATSEPWPGTEGFLGVFLEVLFVGNDTLFEESFGFGLTVILPDEKGSIPSNKLSVISRIGVSATYQSST